MDYKTTNKKHNENFQINQSLVLIPNSLKS